MSPDYREQSQRKAEGTMSRSIPTEDYYETLGLSQNCTEDDIKRAYRQFSVLVHPDKHMNESPELQIVAETVFKIVSKLFSASIS